MQASLPRSLLIHRSDRAVVPDQPTMQQPDVPEHGPCPSDAAETDPPRLWFLSGSCQDTEFVVPAEGCTLGRSRSCSVRMDSELDTLVSGHHARIRLDGQGRWWIEDLDSKNGTWKEESRLQAPAPIAPDDEFSLGPPRVAGSVRFYVRFLAARRRARAGDPPRPRIGDLVSE